MFEPEVFGKHMYCIENSNIVGPFRRPGNCAPLRYAQVCTEVISTEIDNIIVRQ